MPFDLFISYSRRDNLTGRITELKQRIETDYRAFAGEDLRCYFDVQVMEVMADWRHNILTHLRESSLLLLVLSPAYLESKPCEWEIVEYLKYEHSRAVGGEGIAPIYFVEVPGLDKPGFEQRAAAWLARVRRRNHFDLRPWFDEGADALKRQEVRARLDDLGRTLQRRISKLRRLASAPGNLPAHNPTFVGREKEMQTLHESAGLGRFGVLTAIQGLGGLGKTALAIQYAYAYADFYPGGRWLVGCAGKSNLASIIRELESDLGIVLSDEDKRDDHRAARRILAELERRARHGAEARAGEKDPPQPRALLLLDNVEAAALLQPPQSDLLSGRNWLHVLATTRLGAADLGHDPARQTLLAVDELPEEDAVRLIESLQPGARFPTEDERAAAREIAQILGGFTLAVEVVAVHLAERGGRITCAAFRDRLTQEGFGGLESAAEATRTAVNHRQKLIGATLGPTLDLLSPAESLVLAYAALMPPDLIPLPWLRALVAPAHPDLGRDADPGYDDPWLDLVNHLIGLRLFQIVDLDPETKTPRLVRMHRLAGDLVREREPDVQASTDRLGQILEHAVKRASFVHSNWFRSASRWELDPLFALSEQLEAMSPQTGRAVDELTVTYLDGWLGSTSLALCKYARSKPLLERTLRAFERLLGPEHPHTMVSVTNLAQLLKSLGNYSAAQPLCERALVVNERVLGAEHPGTLLSVNNLAGLLETQGDYAAAQPLYERTLEVSERVLGPEHPGTLLSINNLAGLLKSRGDYAAARPLYERALEARERVLGPEHPNTLASIGNLAGLFHHQGDWAAAKPLLERALTTSERVLGPEHPDTLVSMNNLAVLLSSQGDYGLAQALYERALEVRERALGLEHPATLMSVNNLAGLLQRKGDCAAARPLYELALEAMERVLGPEHPDTLTGVSNLGSLLENEGDYAAARPLYERALEARERVLGPEHPNTLMSANNLGSLLENEGDCAAALLLYERALEGYLKLSIKNQHTHPHFEVVAINYAGCLEGLGYSPEEIQLAFEEVARRCYVDGGE